MTTALRRKKELGEGRGAIPREWQRPPTRRSRPWPTRRPPNAPTHSLTRPRNTIPWAVRRRVPHHAQVVGNDSAECDRTPEMVRPRSAGDPVAVATSARGRTRFALHPDGRVQRCRGILSRVNRGQFLAWLPTTGCLGMSSIGNPESQIAEECRALAVEKVRGGQSIANTPFSSAEKGPGLPKVAFPQQQPLRGVEDRDPTLGHFARRHDEPHGGRTWLASKGVPVPTSRAHQGPV